ncbi:MAG: ATP-grasp domain-containing protein [Candidatus Micrarchaeaceae archaeon]
MELFEDTVKPLLVKEGIEVPENMLVRSAGEAKTAYEKLGGTVIIKPIGIKGRGMQGLVKRASRPEEVDGAATALLSITGKNGSGTLMVEKYIEPDREFYIAITIDFTVGIPYVVASPIGGVGIEEIAGKAPDSIMRFPISMIDGLNLDQLLKNARPLFGTQSEIIGSIANKLYRIFMKYDAETIEINPLLISKKGEAFAVDAFMNINDDSIYRQEWLNEIAEKTMEDSLEKEMRKMGWSYVELNGDVGIVCSGAGLSMATLDMMEMLGGKPANFLDMAQVNGDGIYKALKLIASKDSVKAILVHLFAGLNDCGDMAEGIKKFIIENGTKTRIVTRIIGNNESAADSVLSSVGITNNHSIENAIKEVLGVGNGNTDR